MPAVFKSISALEKCFLDESIASKKEETYGRVLRGEEFAFEIAYTNDNMGQYPRREYYVEVISPLSD